MRALKSRQNLLLAGIALACFAAGSLPALAGHSPGYLGVMLQDIQPSMAKALQMGDLTGVLVTEVIEDSPADKGGMEDGDVILEFDGQDISDRSDLTEAVGATEPGTEVKIVVLREGKQKKLKFELGERESGDFSFNFKMPEGEKWVTKAPDARELKEFLAMAEGDRGYLGVELDDLGDQLGEYFGVEDGAGALVTKVEEDSPADEAGMKAGDVITKVGGKDIESLGDLLRVLHKSDPGDKIEIKVVRSGHEKKLTVKLGEMPKDKYGQRNRFYFQGDNDIASPPHVWDVPDPDDRDMVIKRLKGIPRVEILGDKIEAEEMQELHKELDKLRKELDKLREEISERK